jgi:hypothetical protein
VQSLSVGGFRVTVDGISKQIAQAAFLMPFADTPGEYKEVVFYRVKKDEKASRTISRRAAKKREPKSHSGV